jgi:hypothetical protein
MSKSRNPEKIYEKELRPLIQKVNDPVRAKELAPGLNYDSGYIGRVLSHVSRSEEYEIERKRDRDNNSFYTLEGKTPSGKSNLPTDDRRLAEDIIHQLSGNSDEVDDLEFQRAVSERLESRNYDIEVKLLKIGEIRDYIKEKENIEYRMEESVFKLER